MGDFNAKVGVQEGVETRLGHYGLGRRNHRGQMLVDFLERQGLFLMNSFFEKKPQRRWTWRSPDTVTKNEIDFIVTDTRRIFRDVSVINRFNTGSDQRLVRGTLNMNFQLERRRLMGSTLRPTSQQIVAGSKRFQFELKNRFDALETTDDIDEAFHNVVQTIRDEGTKFYQAQRTGTKSKLSAETLELIRQRREDTDATPSEHRARSKQITKLVRRDLRRFNTRLIEEAIERNRGSKVFVQQLGRSHLTKLKTSSGL